MTVNARCVVCSNSDLRRLIELGWNAKMSLPDLVHALGGVPSAVVIKRHLKEHAEGAWTRQITVEDARPMRERVLAIQRAQVEAIERQLAIAQQRADDYNEAFRELPDFVPQDPSDYFDILSKDMQAAISSILKSEGLTIKREVAKDANKVDLFRLMMGGAAPAALIEDGVTVEGVAVEVPSEG